MVNNGELIHGQERGNINHVLRGAKRDKAEIDSNSQVFEREELLYRFYVGQIKAALVNLIDVEGIPPKNWKVDWTLLETMLRQGFLVPVGQDGLGNIRILNYANLGSNFGLNLYMGIGFGGEGIIKDDLTGADLRPITTLEPTKGDYVIFSNKNIRAYLNFSATSPTFDAALNLAGMSDESIIEATADALATNRASAFQNMVQMRSSMVYTTKNKNVTGGNLVSRWLNGYTVLGVDNEYDVQNQINTLAGAPNLDSFLQGLRTEQDYILSDFAMWLGISAIGSLKESGINDMEAAGKLNQTENFAEIYLGARQDPLNKLCVRFGGDLKARYKQQSAQYIENIMEMQEAQTLAQKAEAEQQLSAVEQSGTIPDTSMNTD